MNWPLRRNAARTKLRSYRLIDEPDSIVGGVVMNGQAA